jgi:hypothetical protein
MHRLGRFNGLPRGRGSDRAHRRDPPGGGRVDPHFDRRWMESRPAAGRCLCSRTRSTHHHHAAIHPYSPSVHRHGRRTGARGSRIRCPHRANRHHHQRGRAGPGLLLDSGHRSRPLHLRAGLRCHPGDAAGHHHDQGHSGHADPDDLRRPVHVARASGHRHRQQRPVVEPGQLDQDGNRPDPDQPGARRNHHLPDACAAPVVAGRGRVQLRRLDRTTGLSPPRTLAATRLDRPAPPVPPSPGHGRAP